MLLPALKIPKNCQQSSYWPEQTYSAHALQFLETITNDQQTCPQGVLFIAESVSEAKKYFHALHYFTARETQYIEAPNQDTYRTSYKGKTLDIAFFSDYETLPYDVFSPNKDLISQRLKLLNHLANDIFESNTVIVVASITSLLQKLTPKAFVYANSLSCHRHDKIELSKLIDRLLQGGYQRVETVREHGDYCIRGSILDIYPMGTEYPLRLDFFDDELDSIRFFEPESQLTISQVEHFELLPAHEFILNKHVIERFKVACVDLFEQSIDSTPFYKNVTNGELVEGIEYYLPLFHPTLSTIFDYMPDACLIVETLESRHSAKEFWHQVNERYEGHPQEQSRPILKPKTIYTSLNDWNAIRKNYQRIELNHSGISGASASPLPEITLNPTDKNPFIATHQLLEVSEKTLFCAANNGRKGVLLNTLKRADIEANVVENWQQFLDTKHQVSLCVSPLADGFFIDQHQIAIITESELLGRQVSMAESENQPTFVEHRFDKIRKGFVQNLLELELDDVVVHVDHGIGQYKGLKTIIVAGRQEEFLMLEYAHKDILYAPIQSLHLISPYRHDKDNPVQLHKLGGEQWKKSRDNANKTIRDSAAELLEIYARRETHVGTKMSCNEQEYVEFCNEFPFDETNDQLQAILAIREDMAKSQPMDRLVCGDVGFGKTEVAMRAAFIAVLAKKQVLLLVPTTLLATQHFETFLERFQNWPIKTEMLSRLRTQSEQNVIIDNFAQRKVDILIGTHKLLHASLNTDMLGLLIIDEEHRFGVRQKEQLKAMRTAVDILALTATPIPRTLNMALSALRDISIIAEPPALRLPVKTFVHSYDLSIIKEAIERELLRGGQVFFLHNEIRTIERTAASIQKLVPHAKVVVGHGQMRERVLEQVMFGFYHQRHNVLVCSTIIETGIDISNANTIIIERADKLGLAQLHQLRGRTGRSHHQAYAYLLIPDKTTLSKDAKRRLDALETENQLGSGFNLATHDLDIRGAGELLGENQSGQIQSVGFNLFHEMLEQAVSDLRSGKHSGDLLTKTSVDINLTIPALIPHDYLSNVNLRLGLYKRISSSTTVNELGEIEAEMLDRFGSIPVEVHNLLAIAELRQLAEKLGIDKIHANEQTCKLKFTSKTTVDPVRLVNLIQQHPQLYKMEGASTLVFMHQDNNELNDHQQRINTTEALLNILL